MRYDYDVYMKADLILFKYIFIIMPAYLVLNYLLHSYIYVNVFKVASNMVLFNILLLFLEENSPSFSHDLRHKYIVI